jgi:ABC-type lipoprotein export system ATPase subunit
MPSIDVVVESEVDLSIRARQVCGMFDCPPEEKQRLQWTAELPIEDKDWNVGLIVGPSGCGKTTVARHLWPDEITVEHDWSKPTVIDCFSDGVEETAKALSAVGFNTIPAWLRPYHVLSNGEKFRVDMARRIVEQKGTIVVDEFTSVVDRQVAKFASHAIQKYVRKSDRQMVAVSCHDDIIDWLQPEWVFRPDTRTFQWRSVQPRPAINIEIARLPYDAWRIFAPYHYMTAKMHRAARCFGLWVEGNLASFASVMHRPHPSVNNIKGLSRVVTLPDYQGLGLIFVLTEKLGAAYKAQGWRFRNYPAHPVYIRAHRKEIWKLAKRPGVFSSLNGKGGIQGQSQSRPCAVFEYVGPQMRTDDLAALMGDP